MERRFFSDRGEAQQAADAFDGAHVLEEWNEDETHVRGYYVVRSPGFWLLTNGTLASG